MMTRVEKTSNPPQRVLKDGNKAQAAGSMGSARQHLAIDQCAPERVNEGTQKRRKRESTKTQHDNSSSLPPPAKKVRTGHLSGQAVAVEGDPAVQEITDTNLGSPRSHPEIDRHISPDLLETLAMTYEVTSMNVISSSKIQSKVTTIIEKLGSFSFVSATKPNIVLLRAKGAVASKLITISEIAKRDIEKAGGKWYQYNVLGRILTTHEKKPALMKGPGFTLGAKTNTEIDPMDLDDKNDSQSADDKGISFETMKTPLERAIEGTPKVRAVPVVLIFLCRVRSDALKEIYSEQTNDLRI